MPRARRTTRVPRKVGYHHGDLRHALIEAALAVVERKGVAGLTLREAAERAGVTHAATYRHFPDKAALVAALAERGFRRLRELMEEAIERTAADPVARLLALGTAYMRLADEHPAVFRLMFGSEIADRSKYPSLRTADDVAFAELREAIAACQAAGVVREGNPVRLAMVAWAMTHGIAVGWLDGQFQRRGWHDTTAEEVFLRAATVIFGGLFSGGAAPPAPQGARARPPGTSPSAADPPPPGPPPAPAGTAPHVRRKRPRG